MVFQVLLYPVVIEQRGRRCSWLSSAVPTGPRRSQTLKRKRSKVLMHSILVFGPDAVSFAMKTPLVIALAMAVVLGTSGALAAMNYACKSSHHLWSAPSSTFRPHVKVDS